MALTQKWLCQDNTASTTVVASVGTNGTLEGGDNTSAISVSDGPGTALLRSLDLDGTNDAVNIASSSISFASGDNWSVSVWFKIDSFAANNAIIGRSDANTSRLQIQSTGNSFRVTLSSGDNDFTIPTVSTGTWNHVLLTYAAGSLRLFLNGTESSTGTVSVSQAFAPTYFGRTFNFKMNGKMCDVRIYNSNESSNVIAIMAEKDLGGLFPFFLDEYISGGMWSC